MCLFLGSVEFPVLVAKGALKIALFQQQGGKQKRWLISLQLGILEYILASFAYGLTFFCNSCLFANI